MFGIYNKNSNIRRQSVGTEFNGLEQSMVWLMNIEFDIWSTIPDSESDYIKLHHII